MMMRMTLLVILIGVLAGAAPGRAPPSRTGPSTQPLTQPDGAAAPAPLAVPNAALQSRAREMIRGLFKSDYAKKTPADRQALARLLLKQGEETHDDSVARYVAFTEALDLAANSGDAGTVMAAIGELSRGYTVNALDLQMQHLLRAHVMAATVEESEAVMRAAIACAAQAAAVDAFDAARTLADLAEAAGNKTQQVRIVASLQVPLANVRDLIAEFAQVKRAFAALDQNADDDDAHLTIGRFYALHKGQWTLGLPHLARSSDAALRELAQAELQAPVTDGAQLAVADGWWEFAQNSHGVTREIVAAHARQWYATAQSRITGITLARIQSRINNALPPVEAGAAAGGAGAAVDAAVPGVDLLPLIDVSKDAVQGKWSRNARGEVVCESGAYSVLQIPYLVPEEYDLTATFTRTEGSGPVALLLAARGRAFDFALDVKGEARFERVDAKIAKDNPTTAAVTVSNNRRYVLTVEIRKDVIRALLDGKLLTEYKTDGKDLSRYALWKVNDTTWCALGANNAATVFHRVQLTEVTGKGKPAR